MNQTYIVYAITVFLVGYLAYEKAQKHLETRRQREANEVAESRAEVERISASERAEKQIGLDALAANTNAILALQNFYAQTAVGYTEANERQQSQIDSLIEALQSNTAKANNDDAIKLLSGTLKACETIAESTVALKDAVAAFTKLVVEPRDTGDYPENNVMQPDSEAEMQRKAVTFESILRGMTPAQADAEADNADERTAMLSGISLGE